jgi:histidinol phosphatase-like enzyme (inositol monophosphatase family)
MHGSHQAPDAERDLGERLKFAVAAARRAGEVVLGYFQTALAVETKGDRSPVTVADRRAEQELRAGIGASYPGDAILGEEFGEKPGTSGWRWILDPIDGTLSFIRGVPLFGVLIGLQHGDESVLGVAYLPALGEMVYAARGRGCWWLPAGSRPGFDARPARVSAVGSLAEGLVLTTAYDYWAVAGRASDYQRLVEAGRTRGWSDCYAHVLVATGRAEAAVEPVMSIWDSAPFLPILEEAGGTYTDWQGRPGISATETLSTNGKVLGEVLRLLR